MHAALAFALEHRPEAVRYVRRAGFKLEDAEDIVQDAMLRLVSHDGAGFKEYGQGARGYWYTCLRQRCIDTKRFRARHEPEPLPLIDNLDGDGLDVAVVVEQRERLNLVAQSVKGMSPAIRRGWAVWLTTGGAGLTISEKVNACKARQALRAADA